MKGTSEKGSAGKGSTRQGSTRKVTRHASSRPLLVGVAATTVLVVAGLVAAHAAERGLLWRVIQTCVANARITGAVFPCLDVDLTRGVERGYAVLRAPFENSHIVVVPTAKIDGVEAPVLLEPGDRDYFADAWAARRFVAERVTHPLARDNIGMALNSLPGRSQDQLHIHVDCVQPSVREALTTHAGAIHVGAFSRFPVALHNDRYWAVKVRSADLRGVNVFRLVMDGLKVPEADRAKVTIVAIGATFADGEDGFYVLSLTAPRARHDQGHGEFLLDHSCTAPARS